MKIKNIVFDRGDVWARLKSYAKITLSSREEDPEPFFNMIEDFWQKVSLGELDENIVINIFGKALNLEIDKLLELTNTFSTGEVLSRETNDLITELYEIKETNIFFTTCNAHKNIDEKSDKSKALISLLAKCQIDPSETVFIDNNEEYVTSVRATGIRVIHYKDAKSCREELIELSVIKERMTTQNWISNIKKGIMDWTSNFIEKILINLTVKESQEGLSDKSIDTAISCASTQLYKRRGQLGR